MILRFALALATAAVVMAPYAVARPGVAVFALVLAAGVATVCAAWDARRAAGRTPEAARRTGLVVRVAAAPASTASTQLLVVMRR